jgi:hypothetical protein
VASTLGWVLPARWAGPPCARNVGQEPASRPLSRVIPPGWWNIPPAGWSIRPKAGIIPADGWSIPADPGIIPWKL